MTAAGAPAAQAAREEHPASELYGHLSPAERYIHRTRDEALLALLRRHGIDSLAGVRILELGCGEGSFLRTLSHYGAMPELLTGVDKDARKLDRAAQAAPGIRLIEADGASLPGDDGAFDLAFAFTFFSSVTDRDRRRRAANEALRVLRPGGLLLVYDFWTNPLNRRVRPLAAREVRHLFAPHRLEIERVTLAPPIVRVLGGRAALCRPLERLPFLRTHLLAAVTKERA